MAGFFESRGWVWTGLTVAGLAALGLGPGPAIAELPCSADGGSCASSADGGASPAPFRHCISEDQYQRYRSVKAAENDPNAFRPSAIWLPPIFMTDAEHSYAWAGLLYFHTLDFDVGTRTALLPPVFLSSCTPDSETLVTPIYSYRTDIDGTARLYFTYFQRRDRLAESDIFFPFVWSFRERTSETAPWEGSGAVAPFFFWSRKPNGDHTTLVPPLFWQWGDKDETNTIAANVFLHETPVRSDLGVVPFYFRGRSTSGSAYDISPPLFWSFRDGPNHSLLIPPLLTYHSGDGATETTWALNTYYESRPGGFTLASLPLLFAGRQDDSHYTVVAPVFWRWGDKDETTTIAGNVFWHDAKARSDFGIAPLYFHGRTASGGYDVSPPLFWSFVDGPSHSLLIPPLLTYHGGDGVTETTWVFNTYYQSRPGGFTFASLPLVFTGRQDDSYYTFVPPLVWHWGDRDQTTTIGANVFLHEGKDRTDLGVVPFYFRGRSTSGAAYDISPPLFWSFRDGVNHSLLLPLLLTYHGGDGVTETTWALNTYYQSRPGGFTLASLPLVFAGRQDDSHYTVVAPLFWRWGDKDGTTTIAGNVYWHDALDRSDLGVIPFYFRGRSTAGAAYDVSPPLFWSFRDGPDHSLFLPLLLTYHGGDAVSQTTWVLNTYYHSWLNGYSLVSLPLVFAGRQDDWHYALVPPLFWRWGDKDGTTTIAGNVYWHDDREGSNLGVVPFYFRGRSASGSAYDISPPLFWSFRDGANHSLFIPPLLTYHVGDGSTETTWAFNTYYQSRPNGFTLVSLPLLFMAREGNDWHTALLPFYESWGGADDHTTIAGNVFWHDAKDRHDFGVVPFYFRGRTSTGNDYDISPPLFWSFRDGPNHSLLIPPLLTYHTGDGVTESTWAFNTYYQSRPNGFTLVSLPLVFAGRQDDSHYTVVPPLFWRWGDKGETTTIAGNVYWHDALDRSDLGVVPFYFRGRSTTGSAYDISPPLFWSFRDGPNHSLLIPPLLTYHTGDGATETTWALNTYYQSRPGGFTLASLPLLFAGRQDDSHYTVVAPVFWRWGDKDETTTIAGNVFWHDAKARSDFGIAPLYFHGRTASGGYDVSPPLFWSFVDGPSHSLLIPPLLTYYGGDGVTETTWVFNTYYQSRPGGFTFASLPLVFTGRQDDSYYTYVPPLVWHWGDRDQTTTIGANVFLHEGKDRTDLGVVPFYFRGRSTSGAAYDISPPLFWSFRDGVNHSLLLPLLLTYHGGDGVTESTWVLNTYYQSRPNGFTLASLPLVFAGREGDAHHTVVAPLYWSWGDKDDSTTIVATFFHHTEPTGSVFGLAPFYFGGRGQHSWDLVPPLFYRSADADGQDLTLLPLFHYSESHEDKLFVSPLAVYSKDALHERFVVGGVYWHMEGPDVDARVVAPFWWDFTAKDTQARLTTVFPFYWRYQTTDETTHVLFNVMYSHGQTNLGPSWSLHVFPFVDLASYHPQHFLWQVFAGMVGHETLAESERWRIAWVWTNPNVKAGATPPPTQAPP